MSHYDAEGLLRVPRNVTQLQVLDASKKCRRIVEPFEALA